LRVVRVALEQQSDAEFHHAAARERQRCHVPAAAAERVQLDCGQARQTALQTHEVPQPPAAAERPGRHDLGFLQIQVDAQSPQGPGVGLHCP